MLKKVVKSTLVLQEEKKLNNMKKKIVKKQTKKEKKVTVQKLAQDSQEPKVKTEKERLLDLYQTLKDLGVNSISDLENKIARAE